MSNIIKGDIELNGFFSAWGRFLIKTPESLVILNEKSVNWLFKKNPLVNNLEPNELSMLEVADNTLLNLSTKEKCVVELKTSSKLWIKDFFFNFLNFS